MESNPSDLSYSIKRVIDESKDRFIKEKHVRIAILGSFQDRGGSTFWSVVASIPIHSDLKITWRFLYLFHKLLNEGHPNFVTDSQRYKPWIASLGPCWTPGVTQYEMTVACYSSLLAKRLEFHAKNPQFKGKLQLDEEGSQIEGMDTDTSFQMAADIMNNLSEILKLQKSVFGGTKVYEDHVQLAALIPSIIDSKQFFDILFRLLNKLQLQDLINSESKFNEYRKRFYIQYNCLLEFYKLAKSLKYIKQLTEIPSLSEIPPVIVPIKEVVSPLIDLSNPLSDIPTPAQLAAQIIFLNTLNDESH